MINMKNRLLQLYNDNAGKGQKIHSEVNGDDAVIYLYDAIGEWYGVSAQDYIKELNAITADNIHVRINSPGGDVFDARAMATAMKQHPSNIIVHIDGVAASAATYVALAANSVEMAQGSFFMIHNAWTLAIGNANDFRSTADVLDKVDASIANDYVKKTGLELSEIQQMMADETWFTADEALTNRFIDSVFESDSTENRKQWNLSAYEKVPESLKNVKKDVEKETINLYDREKYEKRLELFEVTA